MSTREAVRDLTNLAVSEIHAVKRIAHYALGVADPEIAKGFIAMLSDESRHARLLIEAVELFGEGLEPLPLEEIHPSIEEVDHGQITDVRLARFLARSAHVESQLPNLTARIINEIENPQLKAEIIRRLEDMAEDEERHRAWAEDQLCRLVDGENSETIKEALTTVDRSRTKSIWKYNCL